MASLVVLGSGRATSPFRAVAVAVRLVLRVSLLHLTAALLYSVLVLVAVAVAET